MVVHQTRQCGRLRTGLRISRAIDLLWIYNDLAHYQALVTDCGWSTSSFTAWLADEMRRNLLGPRLAGGPGADG